MCSPELCQTFCCTHVNTILVLNRSGVCATLPGHSDCYRRASIAALCNEHSSGSMSVVMAASEWVQRDCRCRQTVPGVWRGCEGLQRAIQECPGGTRRHLDLCCASIYALCIHYSLSACYTHTTSCRLVSLGSQHWVQAINSELAIMGTVEADSHIACRSPAMPCVNSHMPCRAPALLRQCRVLRESPRGSRKYPNC
jgi:hypothetical protein